MNIAYKEADFLFIGLFFGFVFFSPCFFLRVYQSLKSLTLCLHFLTTQQDVVSSDHCEGKPTEME